MKDWVDALPLRVYVKNLIRNAGIGTKGHALAMTEDDWLMLPGCGRLTTDDIMAALHEGYCGEDIYDADWW